MKSCVRVGYGQYLKHCQPLLLFLFHHYNFEVCLCFSKWRQCDIYFVYVPIQKLHKIMKHNLSSHFATDVTYTDKTQLGNKHGCPCFQKSQSLHIATEIWVFKYLHSGSSFWKGQFLFILWNCEHTENYSWTLFLLSFFERVLSDVILPV